MRKAHQKSTNLKVRSNGNVELTTWKTAKPDDLKKFVLDHANWISKELEALEEERTKFPPKLIVKGVQFPFLGQFRNYVEKPGSKNAVRYENQELVAFVKDGSQFAQKKALAEFYKRAAKKIIPPRVEHYARLMGLKPKNVSLRQQRSRWGSCSSEGNLSLNIKLISAPPEVIDYVVVHEIGHLQEMNHSKAFWDLVSAHSPRYKLCRKWLHSNQHGFDFLEEVPELHASRIW